MHFAKAKREKEEKEESPTNQDLQFFHVSSFQNVKNL